jgi:glutathione S-transferase
MGHETQEETPMTYELHYWPGIQGRGEFVRLALEQAGQAYVDVAREPEDKGGGERNLMKAMGDAKQVHPSFAPPFLIVDGVAIGQVSNILLFLGARHGLAPSDEMGRLWVNQMQTTITDLVAEAHDTHHPADLAAYYEDQKPEAARRSKGFREQRIAKFLGWFETILELSPGDWLAGKDVSYADLSLFQAVSGLRHAFPKATARAEGKTPKVSHVAARVAELPNIAAYLASPRRIAFNEEGIFRHYPELDA